MGCNLGVLVIIREFLPSSILWPLFIPPWTVSTRLLVPWLPVDFGQWEIPVDQKTGGRRMKIFPPSFLPCDGSLEVAMPPHNYSSCKVLAFSLQSGNAFPSSCPFRPRVGNTFLLWLVSGHLNIHVELVSLTLILLEPQLSVLLASCQGTDWYIWLQAFLFNEYTECVLTV